MAEKPEAITHEAVRDPTDKEWLISIFDVDGQQPDREAGSKHRIQKAPTKFREYEKDKKYFDPRVVSLGPYHHGKDLLKPMEKYKITAAKQFFDRFTNVTGGMGGIYKKFKELTGKLKELYDAEVVANKSDDVFARMMFLDGCFVLHFISNDLIPLIVRDMFLLENHLPLLVLDALMSLRFDSNKKLKGKIVKFIEWEVLLPMGLSFFIPHWWFTGRRDDDPLHLLDAFQTMLLGSHPSNPNKKYRYRLHNFGSVMELKEVGIMFEKSDSGYLTEIRFKEYFFFPWLLLPSIVINDVTISQLLNLTSFKMCSDIHSGYGVTSNICSLDSLINHGVDVKELQSKGILHHALDKVACLFNKWPIEMVNKHNVYGRVKIHMHLLPQSS
ncbi:uncharacterized protein LOC131218207 [Magnolia sinica]|uniref:uncharacterized protein LOC131218207 n=1 Tax=Magnolia sinica TaxID=86752 RepID=UPI0026584E47|nr:uncharacterized protein LOC131218207 [Magnolia sinica]